MRGLRMSIWARKSLERIRYQASADNDVKGCAHFHLLLGWDTARTRRTRQSKARGGADLYVETPIFAGATSAFRETRVRFRSDPR